MQRENCFTEGGDQFFILLLRHLMGRKASAESPVQCRSANVVEMYGSAAVLETQASPLVAGAGRLACRCRVSSKRDRSEQRRSGRRGGRRRRSSRSTTRRIAT